jgi:hypothetical protein
MFNPKLLNHQQVPASQLLRSLQNGAREWGYAGAVDMSDVGMGKTYCDLAAALETGRRVAVLCPVVGVEGWRKAFSHFGAEPYHIGSYEAVRGNWRPSIGQFGDKYFEWNNPSDIIIIADEAQITRNMDSITTACIGGAIKQQIPIICASATLALSPLELRIAGRITGLHKGGEDWIRFMYGNGCRYNENEDRWWWDKSYTKKLVEIHKRLIPQRGCRMRKSDLGDEYAGTTIEVLPFIVEEFYEIERKWENADKQARWMQAQGIDRNVIMNVRRGNRMKAWKASEMALVPHVCKKIQEDVKNGNSVAAFFSFTESRELAGSILGTKDGFFGGQSPKKRKELIEKFQLNEIHILLSNIGAGGASVSLHDTTGTRPRVSYIFPTDQPVKMGQAVGRIDRCGGKTHAKQYIPCIAGGMSQFMVEGCAKKLRQLQILNDGQ